MPGVFVSIFEGAFSPTAVTGGVVGTMITSMHRGVSRGIFSNEAGLGTGSIAHACADTDEPVHQGMFGIFEVFIDTIVICTLTALVILCSGVSRLWRGGRGGTHHPGFHGGIRQLGIGLYGGGDVLLCLFHYDRMGAVWYALHRVSVSEKAIKPFMVVYSLVCCSWRDDQSGTYVEHRGDI